MKIKEFKEFLKVIELFDNDSSSETTELKEIDKYWIGKKVIVRTYSAGVHYGEIELKSGTEVILKNARRLYYWKTNNNGISLSEVANAGLHKESKVCQAVSKIWLNAIELIECSDNAIKDIERKDDFKA